MSDGDVNLVQLGGIKSAYLFALKNALILRTPFGLCLNILGGLVKQLLKNKHNYSIHERNLYSVIYILVKMGWAHVKYGHKFH